MLGDYLTSKTLTAPSPLNTITQISGHLIHHALNPRSRLRPPNLFPSRTFLAYRCLCRSTSLQTLLNTYFSSFFLSNLYSVLSRTAWDANRFSQFVKAYQVSNSKNTDLYQFFVLIQTKDFLLYLTSCIWESFERHLNCNFRSKTNGKVRGDALTND